MSEFLLTDLNPIRAADPSNNAIVKASAGVGKTYLLVTRLLRLLIQGTRPDSILAITFTRKAAAEMQSRLFDRLYQLAIATDADLHKELQAIGINPSAQELIKAQNLYEELLRSEYQVKTSTFHAFCQEILRKFPLEANVPPGFELLEEEGTYRLNAWEALYDEATQNPDIITSQALEKLYDLTGSLHSTHQSLDSFLSQRSDWWAYTKHQADPISFAISNLEKKLDVNTTEDPHHLFFNEQSEDELTRLAKLIATHDTKTNIKLADSIVDVIISRVFTNNCHNESALNKALYMLNKLFFDSKGNRKEQKENKTRLKKLGEAGEEQFLSLFLSLSKRFVLFKEALAKHHNLALSSAWYVAGNRLIEHYQTIKLEQRLLDFTDLEWKTYELLNHSENNLWVQYKLDQRIDHFLIDEFQDTNPTQWRLIYPLIQEFVHESDRHRSVFIVGDEKQSIYSFRRADPKLLSTASDWMVENLGATVYPMDKSRRSSTPIMDLVNAYFLNSRQLPSFHEHSTFLDNIPGRVELLPLIEKEKDNAEPIYFRNPLKQPLEDDDNPYLREGELIVENIQNALNETVIHENSVVRKIKYSDIMILVRSRKHLQDYESALRKANIPYQSNNKGTLFECQEIQDLVALLDVLYTPYNNLALATVIRSPIFQCSNDDLILLSQTSASDSWYEKLQILANDSNSTAELKHAANCLKEWGAFIGTLPMHDLLNIIYHQGNVIENYLLNVPAHFRARVEANLKHFLSLALEMDSGRYPSLGRFICKLHYLMQNEQALDEAATANNQGAVRILTIHASKGLEAPIIFLADCADSKSGNKTSYSSLVQWPEHEETPTDFILCPVKANHCDYIKSLLSIEEDKSKIEDANLLYVALTRARQVLYLSGSTNNIDGNNGWYELLKKHWAEIRCTDNYNPENSIISDKAEEQLINEKPANNIVLFESSELLAQEPENEDIDALQRGIIIHRALELLTQNDNPNSVAIQLCNEFNLDESNSEFIELFNEAQYVIQHSTFDIYFKPHKYQNAFNEIRIQTKAEQTITQGIIDRLIINNNELIILDYKTHNQVENNALAAIANNYKQQMNRYRDAAKKLWPDYEVKTVILFTHYLKAFEVTP